MSSSDLASKYAIQAGAYSGHIMILLERIETYLETKEDIDREILQISIDSAYKTLAKYGD